ncbi:hypothetical protein ONZ43_g5128 [Nemania bipapillata]|uniref:Uncharacterized protein n=1 Tax=Nemania bipapillata TaxID=110536 RepID=A0ACC2IEC8_9PEZI|nr:hypothetical protein ONZ43_g5128 [Nemania bipapillata]
MRVIGEDNWDTELWEMTHDVAESRTPKFYFFFGRRDHWVADHYRDEFIRKRSAQAERTRLVVDESGLPHAFCIG